MRAGIYASHLHAHLTFHPPLHTHTHSPPTLITSTPVHVPVPNGALDPQLAPSPPPHLSFLSQPQHPLSFSFFSPRITLPPLCSPFILSLCISSPCCLSLLSLPSWLSRFPLHIPPSSPFPPSIADSPFPSLPPLTSDLPPRPS